jgi:hypothetical protein
MPGVDIADDTFPRFVQTPGPPARETAGAAKTQSAAITPTVPVRNL